MANRYVELQAAGRQGELVALYAADADLLSVGNQVIHGRDELTSYYSHPAPRKVMPISFVARGNDCFMELASVLPDDLSGLYRLTAINHLTLNKAGLIKRLVIYIRPNLMK